MIQDISPENLDNSYSEKTPTASSRILCFENDRILAKYDAGRKTLYFPAYGEFEGMAVYAFSLSSVSWFLALKIVSRPSGYEEYTMQELRELKLGTNTEIFAAYTAFHLHRWYETSRFCGRCGAETELDHQERAKVCPICGNRIYPRINPAVIVGVIRGDDLLITRYRSGFRHNALIAGFTEIGETVEQTVEREVMEEVGLRVKNIRYYKSQPWGIASDLLMGFYCEADGDTTIHRDGNELGYAEWVRREEIALQPFDYSLTNEMMKAFRDGRQ